MTGGVEKGESFLQGAKREFVEETTLNPRSGKWVNLKYTHHFLDRFDRKAEEKAFGILLKDRPKKISPKLD